MDAPGFAFEQGIEPPPASKRCPGCARAGAACWGAPCLYLQFVLSRPLTALLEWCETVGGNLVCRKQTAKEGR